MFAVGSVQIHASASQGEMVQSGFASLASSFVPAATAVVGAAIAFRQALSSRAIDAASAANTASTATAFSPKNPSLLDFANELDPFAIDNASGDSPYSPDGFSSMIPLGFSDLDDDDLLSKAFLAGGRLPGLGSRTHFLEENFPYSPAAASAASVADVSTANAASVAPAQVSAQSVGESHVAVVVADTVVGSKKGKNVKSKKKSVSSAIADSTDGNNLQKNLFRVINTKIRLKIKDAFKKLETLNFVSTRKEYSPLKAAVVTSQMGIIKMFLVSGRPLHVSDTTTLLDFVDNTIQELQKPELTTKEQRKLKNYLCARILLVNDTGGPDGKSRFSSTTVLEGSRDDSKVLAEAERIILEESQAGDLTPVQLANKILRSVIRITHVSAEARYLLFKKYAQQCDPLTLSFVGVTLLESSVLKADRYFDSTHLLVQKIVSMGVEHKKRALELFDHLKAKKLTRYKKDSSVRILRCLAAIYQAIQDLDSDRYPNTVFIQSFYKRDFIMKDAVLGAIGNDLGTSSDAKAASASSFSHESSTLSAAASAGSGGGGGGGGGSGAAPVAKPRAAKRKLSGDRPPAGAEGNSDESLNKKDKKS